MIILKKIIESNEHADHELMASMKRERDHFEAEMASVKEKRRVVSLAIEEEKDLN